MLQHKAFILKTIKLGPLVKNNAPRAVVKSQLPITKPTSTVGL